MIQVNETGLQNIGYMIFMATGKEPTATAINACAAEAEASFEDGNSAAFVLPRHMTLSGIEETFVLNSEDYDRIDWDFV